MPDNEHEVQFIRKAEEQLSYYDPLEEARGLLDAEEKGLPPPPSPGMTQLVQPGGQQKEGRGVFSDVLLQAAVGAPRDFLANTAQTFADLNLALGNLAPASVEGDIDVPGIPLDPVAAFGTMRVEDIVPDIAGKPETAAGGFARGAATFLLG
ncbi:hypothetical protein LCGC14_2859860, partial [marine sediment metagenome]